ncbi:hypothetical protein ACIBQ1_21395 [Nonomuraea sp. NPDC050153]|uniref:hypothetical protein n=1 Tax=Nonomuraea sp. NPDC050153 TaxID=3364359 RepID=UPI0037B85BB7
MRLRGRCVSVAALLACLAVMSACSAEPERPSLKAAAAQLVADGEKLVASRELTAAGTVTVTERADQDGELGCLKGQVQRFFRAQGDLAGSPSAHSAGNSAGLMLSALRNLGYDKIMDSLDIRDENLSVTLAQNPKTGIIFLVAVRRSPEPNIMIVGKTNCYERSE